MTVGTSALALLRVRSHDRPALCRTCPDCGHPIRDREAARLGFCDRCREFTGMCGAGRRIICPDVMTMTSWHSPCTKLGAVAWEVTMARGPHKTVLCETHDAEMRTGRMPWIALAVPLRA